MKHELGDSKVYVQPDTHHKLRRHIPSSPPAKCRQVRDGIHVGTHSSPRQAQGRQRVLDDERRLRDASKCVREDERDEQGSEDGSNESLQGCWGSSRIDSVLFWSLFHTEGGDHVLGTLLPDVSPEDSFQKRERLLIASASSVSSSRGPEFVNRLKS